MRILAALSGGVDSAVAAARAVESGHDVVAVHLALSRNPASHRTGARGCCTLEDSRDARRVADTLGIPFYIWDLSGRFQAEVIDNFIDEYAQGHTPNPCIRCNESIKFSAVLDRAMALDFDAVCTGHYARLIDSGDTRQLHRSVDSTKDQSYVLAVLDQQQLKRSMFPLGDSLKTEVRREATERGLLVAAKPESFDVCFISNGNTAAWLTEKLGSHPGDVRDAVTGDVLGAHDGAYAFTVGQRRGLGLARPSLDGERRYVVGVDTSTNTVFVGLGHLLDVDEIITGEPRWCGGAPGEHFEALAQIRAHGEPMPCDVWSTEDSLRVTLHTPARGVAPGQSLVVYDGTRALGSGTIDSARRRRLAALDSSPLSTATPSTSV
jgi:tRNA-specific 2-thiouridylase